MQSNRLTNLIEKFVNVTKRETMNLVYGANSRLKVSGASYSPYEKVYYLSATVFVGQIEIDDTILTTEIVSSLIMDFFEVFDPGNRCLMSITIDVI